MKLWSEIMHTLILHSTTLCVSCGSVRNFEDFSQAIRLHSASDYFVFVSRQAEENSSQSECQVHWHNGISYRVNKVFLSESSGEGKLVNEKTLTNSRFTNV